MIPVIPRYLRICYQVISLFTIFISILLYNGLDENITYSSIYNSEVNSSENHSVSNVQMVGKSTSELYSSIPSISPSSQFPNNNPTLGTADLPANSSFKYGNRFSDEIKLINIIPSTRLWNKQKYRKNDSVRLFNMTWMLSKYIPSTSKSILIGSDSESLEEIYYKWKSSIEQSCGGSDLYSFCQHHSLILWDSASRSFYTYAPQPLPKETRSYDLSFVAHTSYE